MKENAWRNMNAASRGSKRSSTWSPTWKRLPRSPEPWAVRHRSNSGGQKGAGPGSFDRFWEGLEQRTGKQLEPEPWIDVLLLGRQYGVWLCSRKRWKGSGSEPFRCRGGAIA